MSTQTVSCEIKFAHAHVRARSHVCDVRAKRLSKRVCDVRACGCFTGVRRAIANSHVFSQKDLNFSFSHCYLSFSMVVLQPIVLEMELSLHKKCKICFKITLLL